MQRQSLLLPLLLSLLLSLLLRSCSSAVLSLFLLSLSPSTLSLIEKYYTLLLPSHPPNTLTSPLPLPPQRLLMSSPPRLSSISGPLRYALYSPNSPEFRSQIPSLKMYECVKKAKIDPNSKDPITIGIINPPQDVEWFVKANKRYKGLKYERERGEMISDDWYMEKFLEILNEQELKVSPSRED